MLQDLEDEQGVTAPRVNSQGKVKTFKCKKCEFVSVTKEEFWKHSKVHIKPEKMLSCPKCVFVTEFKVRAKPVKLLNFENRAFQKMTLKIAIYL